MVTLSLLITRFTTFPIDGYVGVVVSIFILHSGIELGKDTLDTIIGKAPEKEFVDELINSVLSYAPITGVHDLVIHNYGPGRYIASLHAEVPYNIPVMEIHDVIDKAEKEIGHSMNVYLSIHMDPIKTDNPEIVKLREEVFEHIGKIEGVISIHDFRVVGDCDEKTLIFDAVLDKPYFAEAKEKEIKHKIETTITEMYPSYKSIINFDREFY
jgi:divalent metal cation (Fe/Co/Zn/Cd) transporter